MEVHEDILYLHIKTINRLTVYVENCGHLHEETRHLGVSDVAAVGPVRVEAVGQSTGSLVYLYVLLNYSILNNCSTSMRKYGASASVTSQQ